MKLKNYDETIKYYKDLFYTHWYGKGLKEKTISFIEENFVDIEGFVLTFDYGLIYEFPLYERIYFFKFLHSELWDMGMKLTKGVGCDYYIAKRTKEDKFSNFLNYENITFIEAKQEIMFIQMITGKSYREALKTFNKAIEKEPSSENTEKKKENPKITKTKAKTKANKAENKTIIVEDKNIPSDVTEALEQTLISDDSE